MNDFTTGLIIVGVFANLGFLIVIAWRLRKLIKEHSDTYHQAINIEEEINNVTKSDDGLIIHMLREILDKIPNTFEYNGNKGRVYKK